jgi:hypothetical protein
MIHEQHLPPSRPGWLGPPGRLTQLVVDTYLLRRTSQSQPAIYCTYMAGLGKGMQPPYCSTPAVGRLHAYPHPARTGTAQERLDHETAKVGH